ncbi:MAG: bifunctional [glutamate--ammonia ligase]-adenylyl-L-tyrosine phosphorylase/[glutamate--ammonia-ligase] adenylyltransferase [Zetaproteobacteria bacterium]|nr:bifunctional [glutamate--ammonia ligase]-adenylyl-L-tyrosine phosphorylase/[glutamate--ammonia-ligase] adenylyltransferase [Zetaproteobacteria bacterium]
MSQLFCDDDIPLACRNDAARLREISPLFAGLLREMGMEDGQRLYRPLSEACLPDGSETWVPRIQSDQLTVCLHHLRVVKKRALRQLIWWELGVRGDIADSYHAIADVAAALLDLALSMSQDLLAARFGRLQQGGFCVIGLGKLGGRELNLGSDVDPLFIWRGEGSTEGGRKSVHAAEYFAHLSRMLIKLISESTADGVVWPVDMRLRPGGDGAPICLNLEATLAHYLDYGQTWERAMLIKARPVAGDLALGEAFISGIAPFVFRKYTDYTSVAALAEMKNRIDHQAGTMLPCVGYDVKRGRGGIREIEFVIQSMQLLHGGKHAEVRVTEGNQALAWFEVNHFIEVDDATTLRTAYAFWRRCEHAVQSRKGAQTHQLPDDYVDYLSQALGVDDLQTVMLAHAAHVRKIFAERVLPDVHAETTGNSDSWLSGMHPQLLAYSDEDAKAQMQRCLLEMKTALLRGILPERSYAQVESILAVAMPEWLNDANAVSAIAAFSQLLHNIAGRATWIDLLVTHRGALMWLIGALSASKYLAEHISQNPAMLEWPLARARGDVEVSKICTYLDGLVDEEDESTMLASLSQLVDQARIQCALHIDAHTADVRTLGMWLADVADHVVSSSFAWVLKQQNLPEDFPMVALAMGKHGSQEMGLVSDLDMVFVLAGDADMMIHGRTAREWAQRVGRRVIRQLSTPAPFGAGFEFDARLRPSGNSGVLVTTLAGFHDYQRHEAQVWEHQALCRARAVFGPDVARNEVMEVVGEVLAMPREAHAVRAEVVRMRQKMLDHLARHDDTIINLKHDAGGLVDIEFLAQYGRLMFGAMSTSTVTILQLISENGQLEPAWRDGALFLKEAYLQYREMENALRVELWQSIGALSVDDASESWETMRRHTTLKTVSALQSMMGQVHVIFSNLMQCEPLKINLTPS